MSTIASSRASTILPSWLHTDITPDSIVYLFIRTYGHIASNTVTTMQPCLDGRRRRKVGARSKQETKPSICCVLSGHSVAERFVMYAKHSYDRVNVDAFLKIPWTQRDAAIQPSVAYRLSWV